MTDKNYICPYCSIEFPRWYWGVSGRVGGYGSIKKPGLAKANFNRHKKACKRRYWLDKCDESSE